MTIISVGWRAPPWWGSAVTLLMWNLVSLRAASGNKNVTHTVVTNRILAIETGSVYSALNLGFLRCRSMEIVHGDLLLRPASSGNLRKCSVLHFHFFICLHLPLLTWMSTRAQNHGKPTVDPWLRTCWDEDWNVVNSRSGGEFIKNPSEA